MYVNGNRWQTPQAKRTICTKAPRNANAVWQKQVIWEGDLLVAEAQARPNIESEEIALARALEIKKQTEG